MLYGILNCPGFSPSDPYLDMKVPFYLNFLISFLSLSVTYTFPFESKVTSCGLKNWSSPAPSEPHLKIKQYFVKLNSQISSIIRFFHYEIRVLVDDGRDITELFRDVLKW